MAITKKKLEALTEQAYDIISDSWLPKERQDDLMSRVQKDKDSDSICSMKKDTALILKDFYGNNGKNDDFLDTDQLRSIMAWFNQYFVGYGTPSGWTRPDRDGQFEIAWEGSQLIRDLNIKSVPNRETLIQISLLNYFIETYDLKSIGKAVPEVNISEELAQFVAKNKLSDRVKDSITSTQWIELAVDHISLTMKDVQSGQYKHLKEKQGQLEALVDFKKENENKLSLKKRAVFIKHPWCYLANRTAIQNELNVYEEIQLSRDEFRVIAHLMLYYSSKRDSDLPVEIPDLEKHQKRKSNITDFLAEQRDGSKKLPYKAIETEEINKDTRTEPDTIRINVYADKDGFFCEKPLPGIKRKIAAQTTELLGDEIARYLRSRYEEGNPTGAVLCNPRKNVGDGIFRVNSSQNKEIGISVSRYYTKYTGHTLPKANKKTV